MVKYLLILTLELQSSVTKAAITLPALISDNMVMQQNAPVHLWGKATIAEKVNISILKQNITAIADEKGNWETWLQPIKGATSISMTVSGSNTIVVKNILIGEVWLASGQSNMEWDVSQSNDSAKEIRNAAYPEIRLFVAKRSYSDTIKTEIEGKWEICSPESVKSFSAVAYFFGRDLQKKLKVPVGIIEAAWGATNCQSWTPLIAIKADPRLAYTEDDWKKYVEDYPRRKKNYDTAFAQWQILAEQQKAEGKKVSPAPREAQMSWKDKPGVIYNAVIAPLSKYTIRGVIWYQGEANAYERVAYPYRYLFPAMIKAWRDAWQQGNFPFLFVQLSTLNKHPYWPVLRESQLQTLQLVNTGMAVSFDVGDSTDAHYKNKQAIGYRLHLTARYLVYGENIEYSGPVFKQMTIEGSSVRLWFSHAKGLKSSDGNALKGFAIAGADGKFLTANTVIDGETILLYNSAIVNPVLVRYAFKDAPVCNLINGAGLPASPFRTDNFDK
jgi:sialate O-acetylesterase